MQAQLLVNLPGRQPQFMRQHDLQVIRYPLAAVNGRHLPQISGKRWQWLAAMARIQRVGQ